jgi:excisionase family DNA binding protein
MNDAVTSDNDFLMTSGAARLAEVSKETILLWERQGKLPAVKTDNGRRLFRRADVERLKREREARRRTRG